MSNTHSNSSIFRNDDDRYALGGLWRLSKWLRPYWRTGILAFILVMTAATAAVLAPVIISRVVVDGMLLPASALDAPDFQQRAITSWLSSHLDTHPLIAACLLYAFWCSLGMVCSHGFRQLLSKMALNGLCDLRCDLFAHLEKLPASFYDQVAIGRVITRLTNDIEALFELLAGFGGLVGEFVPFFVAISVMLTLDRSLTWDLFSALPLILVVTVLFRTVSRRIYRVIRSTMSHLNENLHENLSSLDVVQLHGREEINFQRYSAINQANLDAENRAILVETFYNPAMDSLAYVAMAAILWFGGNHVLKGTATLGSIILFTQFSEMLFRPIMAMGEQWNVLFRASASCERIFQALDWKGDLHCPDNPRKLPENLRGNVEFRHLTFGYSPDLPVLKDISFTITPGECVAIVGPTGSGKSSLIRLLCRFYNVPEGTIYLDGVDIMQVDPSEVRKRIGVVLQDFHIFPGSVLENITMGNPDVTRSMAEDAASQLGADPFIRALPAGYDTILSDRGENLSQGQRQLLAFTRVLALSPEILILDEATASIDTETERLIQGALLKLKTGRTSIIIAHRLRTIREADRIFVLDKGRLVESGSHSDLLVKGGLYHTLYDLQVQNIRK